MSDSFSPEVIPNLPIPLLGGSVPNTAGIGSIVNTDPQASEGAMRPATIPNRDPVPTPIAQDIIGTSINTSTRSILGSFNFGQVGALEVGNFKQGASGDVRISPNGIIGRDKTGLNYFTLNNNGIVITDGTDATIVDSSGISSTSQFKPYQHTDNTEYTTTSTSYTNIPGSTMTVTNTRSVRIQISFFVYLLNDQFLSNGYQVDVQLIDSFDGATIGTLTGGGNCATYVTFPSPGVTSASQGTYSQPVTISGFMTLAAGTHNLTLQFKAHGGGKAYIESNFMYLLILGT